MKNLYNGNISETLWRSKQDNILRSYGYTYDDLNRLRNAQYLRPVNPLLPNTNLSPIVGTFNESMQYDQNGNIVALQRNGGTESQSPALPIDNLIYNYDGNQLTKVDDSASITDGFKDGINATTEYTYDLNGNMTTDQNKGISSITYNHLNLPTKIIMAGGTITYVYNALGQKVSKTVSNSTISPATTSNTQYFGGFQYNNSILQFFPTAEGYVKNTVVSGANTYDYIFNYTDHLGNIRLSYGIAPGTQLLTIFEENNYYPFGLKHGNYNNQLKSIVNLKDVAFLDTPLDVKAAKAMPIGPDTPKSDISSVANSGYQYKYNGKEWQDELGLNMYAMDMRMYDPAIARWVVQDPVIHLSVSPYVAFENSPVIFSDPSGADVSEDEEGYHFTGTDAQNFFKSLVASTGSDEDESEDESDPGRRRARTRDRNRGRVGSGSILFDARGQELLSHWLSGSGKDLLLNSEEWQDYMRDNDMLNNEFISEAFRIASGMVMDKKSKLTEKSGNYSFEIENGYSTGYEMLHGTQFFSYGVVAHYDKKTDTYTFNFNAKWFDRINPNNTYGADTAASNILNKFYTPKDYNVAIKWNQTITVSGSDIKNNNINGSVATGR